MSDKLSRRERKVRDSMRRFDLWNALRNCPPSIARSIRANAITADKIATEDSKEEYKA